MAWTHYKLINGRPVLHCSLHPDTVMRSDLGTDDIYCPKCVAFTLDRSRCPTHGCLLQPVLPGHDEWACPACFPRLFAAKDLGNTRTGPSICGNGDEGDDMDARENAGTANMGRGALYWAVMMSYAVLGAVAAWVVMYLLHRGY